MVGGRVSFSRKGGTFWIIATAHPEVVSWRPSLPCGVGVPVA